MSELDRLTQEATSKAVIAVGREAAKRAVNQLIPDDEKPTTAEEKPAAAKNRRWKIIALAVLGVFLVVGVVGLLLHYWLYFLAAGIVGVAAMVGWSRLRKRFKTPSVEKETKEAVAAAELPAEPVRVSHKAPDAEAIAVLARAKRAEAELKAQALVEAEAVREQEVDDELKALKARLKP